MADGATLETAPDPLALGVGLADPPPPPTPRNAGRKNSASAAIARAPARTAIRGTTGSLVRERMLGYASYWRPRSHGGPERTGRGRVELTCGGRAGPGDRGGGGCGRSCAGGCSTGVFSGPPPTRPASSSSAAAAKVAPAEALQAGAPGVPAAGRGAPPASRSAALPARPSPATERSARKSGDPTCSNGRTWDPALAGVAHGGGAAQSRGGFRLGATSEGPCSGVASARSPALSARGPAPASVAAYAAAAADAGGAPPDDAEDGIAFVGAEGPDNGMRSVWADVADAPDLPAAWLAPLAAMPPAAPTAAAAPPAAAAPVPAAAPAPALRRPRRAVRSGGLTPRPVLEHRTDRECAREAVRLLVRDRSRCRWRFGEAAVSMIRAGGTCVAVVAERNEGAGRGTIRTGQASLGHHRDDTGLPRSGDCVPGR